MIYKFNLQLSLLTLKKIYIKPQAIKINEKENSFNEFNEVNDNTQSIGVGYESLITKFNSTKKAKKIAINLIILIIIIKRFISFKKIGKGVRAREENKIVIALRIIRARLIVFAIIYRI